MLWKIAFLFLIGMAVLVLFKARPKRGERARRKRRFLRRADVREAARCPTCGAFVLEGASCPDCNAS